MYHFVPFWGVFVPSLTKIAWKGSKSSHFRQKGSPKFKSGDFIFYIKPYKMAKMRSK